MGMWGNYLCTIVHPFPHFQGRRLADTICDPSRHGDGGWKNVVQRGAEVSEEERGDYSGQDGKAERIDGTVDVDELLDEGFDRFGHVVADVTTVGYLGMLDRGGKSEVGNGFRVVPTRNKEQPMVCGDVVSGGVEMGCSRWLCASFLGDL